MKKYVKMYIGDAPEEFCKGDYERRRYYYKCLAFAALLVAQNRTYTGYKELNKVGINADDLIWLGFIQEPQENGSYKVLCSEEVIPWHRKNAKVFYLDTSTFGSINVTDLIWTGHNSFCSDFLWDEESWKSYDVYSFNSLPKTAQQWFLNIVRGGDLKIPASKLLTVLINKVQCDQTNKEKD